MSERASDRRDVVAEDNRILHVIYGLYALGVFFNIIVIAGVVVAYLQRGKALSDVQKSHVVWQIRTFWITLILFLAAVGIGFVLWFVGGFLLMILPLLFFVYRTAKGWLRLKDGRPIDDPTALI